MYGYVQLLTCGGWRAI